MATFLSTNAERRRVGRPALPVALLLFALVSNAASPLHAGNLITLTNGTEIDGKLSLSGPAIHAEAESSPPDTQLTDVLEATFADDPFQLVFLDTGHVNQLPPGWIAQVIGDPAPIDCATVHAGAFTVTATMPETVGIKKNPPDRQFFVGLPSQQDGQFTARLVSMNLAGWAAWAGLQFRDSLQPKTSFCAAQFTPQGLIHLPFRRGNQSEDSSTAGNPVDVPLWLRFTRAGNTVFTSLSSDGNDWDIIAQNSFETLTHPLVGLTISTAFDQRPPKAVFDHISITPLPSSAQLLPAGVLLQGGSLLAGRIARLNLDPAAADDSGDFIRGTRRMPIPRSIIAAVVTLPIDRSLLAQYDSRPGLLMRNGDTMDGNITGISSGQISVSSVLLGLATYKPTEVQACFLAPLHATPAPYEVRLRDGSILNATAVTGTGNAVTITDASGLTLQATPNEIAQIRAGTATVQNLAQLDWKATAPTTAVTPPNPAPANNGAPAAPPAATPAPPLVNSWLGPAQQQVMEADIDTTIDFPLPGKFHAMGVQIALASDSPPNATATIRILANGREIAKSPPFHAGDAPRFLELGIPSPTHIALQAESIFPNTKILYLDPVAIR